MDLDQVLIIDTETDGLKDPYPIQVAYMQLSMPDVVFNHYFVPVKRMEYEAIAVHGITHAAAHERSRETFDLAKIATFDVLIGHNVQFDIRALGYPQCQFIDTRSIAQYLFPDWEGHRLSTCMFYVYPSEEEALLAIKAAHDAVTDIHNTKKLYFFLAQFAGIDPFDVEAMIQLSNNAIRQLNRG